MTSGMLITILISVACIISLFIFLIIRRKPNYKKVGTMHIDMSRNDKDICLFTLDLPLNDIVKEEFVILRVDGTPNLKEWTK